MIADGQYIIKGTLSRRVAAPFAPDCSRGCVTALVARDSDTLTVAVR